MARAARRDAVEAAVRSYREAMRRFATMRNLELWYARLDAARILSHVGDRVTAEERRAFERRVAGARAKDHLRAMSKLAQRVDGEPRIVSRPPRIVPVEELFPADGAEEVEDQMRSLLRAYRRSLPVERRHLLEGYRYRHMARRVGGVGSVGTRTWIVLLTGRDGDDPLFLQVKEAGPSALEPYVGRDPARNHGQRVVQGQRLMQVDTDIFLGWLRSTWTDDTPRDYYVRQLWDWKLGADVELMSPARLTVYGTLCGWTLARAHARSGDRSRSRRISARGRHSTAPSALSRKPTRTRTSATTPRSRKQRARAASRPTAAYDTRSSGGRLRAIRRRQLSRLGSEDQPQRPLVRRARSARPRTGMAQPILEVRRLDGAREHAGRAVRTRDHRDVGHVARFGAPAQGPGQ